MIRICVVLLATVIMLRAQPFATVNGDTVTFGMNDLVRNCGAAFDTYALLEDFQFTVVAHDTGGMATCDGCYFDVDVVLSGVPPGSYTADFYTYDIADYDVNLGWLCDTSYIGEVQFMVEADPPQALRTLSSYQSPCSHSAIHSESWHPRELFTLSTYPNPFNTEIKIEIFVPESEPLTLQVFNVRGELCSTLSTGFVPAGLHHFYWDAGGLASGVYLISGEIYRGRVQTKVLLLK